MAKRSKKIDYVSTGKYISLSDAQFPQVFEKINGKVQFKGGLLGIQQLDAYIKDEIGNISSCVFEFTKGM